MMQAEDTIVARATPGGIGALAIIRLCGPQTQEICLKCVREKERFSRISPKKISRFTIISEENEMIDDVTIIVYREPKSPCGEEMAEIFCHGGPIIVQTIIELIHGYGARMALPGEFTRRAVLNGKIDILKAESIGALINSKTVSQRKNAVALYQGETGITIEEIQKRVINIIASIETMIEFPEEGNGGEKEKRTICEDCLSVAEKIRKEVDKGNRLLEESDGISIPIVGPKNGGKSSIFNQLLLKERAIVHHDEGTTRDLIMERVIMKGNEIILIDTAGFGKGENEVETIGIEKSWDQIKGSGIIIWVTPADKMLTTEEERFISQCREKKVLVAINKVDLCDGRKKRAVIEKRGFSISMVSANSGLGVDQLVDEIHDVILHEQERAQDCVITTTRHADLMKKIEEECRSAAAFAMKSEEVASYHLRNAIKYLDEYTGTSGSEEILNAVFSSFCVGK